MKKKKMLALLLTTAMVVSTLAGCGSNNQSSTNTTTTENSTNTEESNGTASGTTSSSDVVHVGIAADPGSLSPFAPMSQGGIAIRRTLYEFLVDREEFGGDMVGLILKDYEQIDDLTYHVTIYDYVHDTEGNPVTASDVAFSYNTGKSSGNLPKLNSIESVTAIDDTTVEFVFTQKLAVGELEGLWMECPIITQAAFEASPDEMATSPVGTTAYKVTEYISGSKIVMERTDNYWQTDTSAMPITAQSNIAAIEFDIITESAQMTIALETGSIDITTGVSNNEVYRFQDGGESADNYDTFQYMNNPANQIYFNCDNGKILQNQALREAIAYAIDAEACLDGAYNGDGKVLKTIGCEKYGDYNDAWTNEDYFEYDDVKAAELLKESGESDVTLTLLCQNTEDAQSLATIIQAYLLQIGITVEIRPFENAMYTTLTYETDAWDICLAQQGSTDYLVNMWKLGWAEENYDGHAMNFLVDSDLQELLHECLTVEGHTQENVDAFHYYIKDNCYAYGLCQSAGYVVAKTMVTNILLDSRNCILPGACTYE